MAHDGTSDVDAAVQDRDPQFRNQEDRPGLSEGISTPNTAPLSGVDEASRLRELQADVRDQDDLERDISRQVYPNRERDSPPKYQLF